VRIGVVMLSVAAKAGRDREVLVYSRRLAEGLLRVGSGHEFIYYVDDGAALEDLPALPHGGVARARNSVSLSAWLEDVAHSNPDHLDWLIVLDPFDPGLTQGPPVPPLHGPKVAACVHDLVPFLFQERELRNPSVACAGYQTLERIRQYDALLVPSETTRSDCLRLLGLRAERVHCVGLGGGPPFEPPDRSVPLPARARRELFRLGVRRSFVLALARSAGRQNLGNLARAFLALPERLRERLQLVIAGSPEADEVHQLRRLAAGQRPDDALVLTGAVGEETLRILHQYCTVFVSPSTYEGVGLSVVDALCCGSAVVVGNNTAQLEVLGDAGLPTDAGSVPDLTEKLERILNDESLAESLRERALARSGLFSWESTARHVLDALIPRRAPSAASWTRTTTGRSRRLRPDPPHRARPRIAFFAPLAPKISGISDYSARLIAELKKSYTIDLYHDTGYVPNVGLSSPDFGCFDHRLFERHDGILGYHAIVYQMGNSVYHGFLYDVLQKHSGVVTLHDFCLSAFQYWHAHVKGWGVDGFWREVAYNAPEKAAEYRPQEDAWREEDGGIPVACARRGLYLNRRIFEHATAVAVHSPWGVARVCDAFPEHAARTSVIPMGATLSLRTPEQRQDIRARFGIDPEALVVASFGILTHGKMNEEAVTAFERVAGEFPGATLLFVGEEWDEGQTRQLTARLGLTDRVRFLGRQPMADFLDLITVTDVGIALRRPPTDGETSAALLDLLRSGVATITSDVGTFAGYPEDVVRKVRWPGDGLEGLTAALRRLMADPGERSRLARAALDYVGRNHSWSNAAALYGDLIERSAWLRWRGRRGRSPLGAGPIPQAHHVALVKDLL
jgi:glycosyltransferase involved in cell wall biosynthesis